MFCFSLETFRILLEIFSCSVSLLSLLSLSSRDTLYVLRLLRITCVARRMYEGCQHKLWGNVQHVVLAITTLY